MAEGRLPDEGPVRIGPVSLPPGKLITGHPDLAIAWATVDPVPESGRAWAALSELHPQTGLIPIQLDGLPGDSLRREGLGGDDLRPWDSGEFQLPEDPREAGGLDAGAVLEDLWDGWVPPDGGDPEERAMREPFTLQFPGLAPPGRTPLTTAERQRALGEVLPRIRESDRATPDARIGLIPAGRPADVLAAIGWQALADSRFELLHLTAVLRSWEDRFGARLIDIGYGNLRLLVDRPPRTLEAAQRIAAEQVVLADDCIDYARHIPRIAPRLVNAPIWTFWWY